MKVKLAAQTLSSSVADALQFCDKELNIGTFKNTSATIKFIRIVDRLFDILNSRNPLAHGFKAPLRKQNEYTWRPFLLEAITYLKGLKLGNGQLVGKSLCKTGIISFIASAMSAMLLFDTYVKQQQKLKYLLTYKYSQDHLELFFAVIRSRGGDNNNPSALQLKATWKRLLTHNQIKSISTGNCIPVDHCKLLCISDTISRMQESVKTNLDSVTGPRRCDAPLTDIATDTCRRADDHDYLPNVDVLSTFTENVVVYIAGYVVRSLLKKIKCETCQLALQSTDLFEDTFRNDFALVCQKDRGGLIRPSSDVVAVCKSAERCVRDYTASCQKPICAERFVSSHMCTKVMSHFIGTSVFSSLSDHALEMEPVDNHQVQLIRLVAQCYIQLRLHHQCRTYTRLVQGANCRSVLNKTVLFKGQ